MFENWRISLGEYHWGNITGGISLEEYHWGNITGGISLREYHWGNITGGMSLGEYHFVHFCTSENTGFMTLYERKNLSVFNRLLWKFLFSIVTQHNIYLNSIIRRYLCWLDISLAILNYPEGVFAQSRFRSSPSPFSFINLSHRRSSRILTEASPPLTNQSLVNTQRLPRISDFFSSTRHDW